MKNSENPALINVQKWSALHHLGIHEDKTEARIFTPKSKPLIMNINVIYTGKNVLIVNSVKTLAVIFSENMLWKAQIDFAVSKLSHAVGRTIRYRYRYILTYASVH